MKTIAIIQARLGSSRLPGKVLLDIAGQPMLSRVMARLRRSILLDGLVVATTLDESWMPLRKSKPSAKTITAITMTVMKVLVPRWS